MQLVNTKINLFVPVRGLSETKLYGPDEVKEKLGVTPSQVVDLKALMGDSSDNYPGVAGIGPVAAMHLLEKYHHLDNIYSHLTEIKPAISEKLTKDKDNAYLSQKLATIVTNIPLKLRLRDTKIKPSTYDSLEKLFVEYNFKSLISRLRRHHPVATKIKVQSNQTSLF